MAGGRPTKYKRLFCEQAVGLMGQGCSIVQVAAEFNVSKDTIFEWEKVHSEFSDSLAIGRVKAEAFWEKILNEQAQLKNTVTNGNLALILKCRYRWTEKQDIDIRGDVGVTVTTPEERKKRLEELTRKANGEH